MCRSHCNYNCSPFFFFFQAEDGIRDTSVTGVQTCALPIFAISSLLQDGKPDDLVGYMIRLECAERIAEVVDFSPKTMLASRSEERRVGKECRSRWWPYR